MKTRTIKQIFYYLEEWVNNLVWFAYREELTESREKIIDSTLGKTHAPTMYTFSVQGGRKKCNYIAVLVKCSW